MVQTVVLFRATSILDYTTNVSVFEKTQQPSYLNHCLKARLVIVFVIHKSRKIIINRLYIFLKPVATIWLWTILGREFMWACFNIRRWCRMLWTITYHYPTILYLLLDEIVHIWWQQAHTRVYEWPDAILSFSSNSSDWWHYGFQGIIWAYDDCAYCSYRITTFSVFNEVRLENKNENMLCTVLDE